MTDFQAGLDPPPNPQTLLSPDLFSNLKNDDDFALHIKSTILNKRAYTLIWLQMAYKQDVTLSPEFHKLEQDTMEFLSRLSPSAIGVTMQVDLMVATINSNTTLIHIYRNLKGVNAQGASAYARLKAGISAIVKIAHQLNVSTFDLGLLHYRVFNGFAMSAKVICHEINDNLSSNANDDLLVEALQALDAILSVFRRAQEKIPHASRFAKLLERFRSGGWSRDVIDHTLSVFQISPQKREEKNHVAGPEDWQFSVSKYADSGFSSAKAARMAYTKRQPASRPAHPKQAYPETEGSIPPPAQAQLPGPENISSFPTDLLESWNF